MGRLDQGKEWFVKNVVENVKNVGSEIASNLAVGGAIKTTATGNLKRAQKDLGNASKILNDLDVGAMSDDVIEEYKRAAKQISGKDNIDVDAIHARYGGKEGAEFQDQINYIDEAHKKATNYQFDDKDTAIEALQKVNKATDGGSVLRDIGNTALNYYGLKDVAENAGRDKVLKVAASRYGTTAAGVWAVGTVADGIMGGYGD